MKVLVCIDGSETGEIVLESLAANVWPANTEWMILTVVVPDLVDILDDALPYESHSATERESILNDAVSRIRLMNSGTVVGAHIALGNPGKEILSAAKGWNSDLIVIGTSNRMCLSKTFLGTASSHILKGSECPVLILRNDRSFKNVCVAMDGTETDATVLAWLESRPWRADTRFHFVTVISPFRSDDADSDDVATAIATLQSFAKAEDAALDKLHREVANLSRLAVHECLVDVIDGQACEKILEYAGLIEADLLVLGSHNRGLFGKLLVHSVSLETSLKSSCTIAVVKRKNYAAQKRADDFRAVDHEEIHTPRVPMPH